MWEYSMKAALSLLYLFLNPNFAYGLRMESNTALGPTQPPIQCVTVAFSQGLKRLEREADHSPPSNAEVKNIWSYTSTPAIGFHGVVLS
jgi:hypothetical protein